MARRKASYKKNAESNDPEFEKADQNEEDEIVKPLDSESLDAEEREKEITEMVQLVGEDAIPDSERILLMGARLIRENFLRQNAYHPVDATCSMQKQYWMLVAFLKGHEIVMSGLDDEIPLESLLEMETLEDLARINELPDDLFPNAAEQVLDRLSEEIRALGEQIRTQRARFEEEGSDGQSAE